jgi:hypothetical protein
MQPVLAVAGQLNAQGASGRAFALPTIFLTAVAVRPFLAAVTGFATLALSAVLVAFAALFHPLSGPPVQLTQCGVIRGGEKHAASLLAERPSNLPGKTVAVLGEQSNALADAQVLGKRDAEASARHVENDDAHLDAVRVDQRRRTAKINARRPIR